MIDRITPDGLHDLAAAPPEPTVSLYLPTHRAGPERDQDPIRFQNLLRAARSELVGLGFRDPDAAALLDPASSLLDDSAFWAELDEGLAVLVRAGETATFRLPAAVESMVVVANHFHITPLVAAASGDGAFHLLALTRSHVQLFRASRHRITEVDLGDVPTSREAALRYDDRERQLHLHGSRTVGGGRVAAAFHGHADDKDLAEADLVRFLRIVDDGVCRLSGSPAVPMVLAGTDRVVAAFQDVTRYPDVLDGAVAVDPASLPPEELRERAWSLVGPRFERSRDEAAAGIASGGRPSSSTVAETVTAAGEGRVAALFVAAGEHRWGELDLERWTVDERDDRRPGDRDLLDSAAALTLSHGGDVFVVEPADVPGDGPLAALLRY